MERNDAFFYNISLEVLHQLIGLVFIFFLVSYKYSLLVML